jgi:hypothetical protein
MRFKKHIQTLCYLIGKEYFYGRITSEFALNRYGFTQHLRIMSTTTSRTQTSFRLSDELLERLRDEAKYRNRSLDNLVESVLMAHSLKNDGLPVETISRVTGFSIEEIEALD